MLNTEQEYVKYRTGIDIYALFLILFTIFIGFRQSGYDYYGYYFVYNQVNMFSEFADGNFIELGFQWLCKMSPSYSILILIVAFISLSLTISFFFRISRLPLFSLLVFFTTIMFPMYMGQIRQAIAISIVFWSIYFYSIGKRNYAMFGVLFATLFHISALLALLMFFVNDKQLSVKKYLGLLILSSLVGTAMINYAEAFLNLLPKSFALAKITHYYESQDSYLGLNMTILLRIATFFLLFYLRPKGDSRYIVLMNLYFVSILIYLNFGFISQIAGRGCLYFSALECVMIPNMIRQSYSNKYFYCMLSVLFVLISLYRYVNFFAIPENYNDFIPYLKGKL